jgi:hypothetical protein
VRAVSHVVSKETESGWWGVTERGMFGAVKCGRYDGKWTLETLTMMLK